MSQDTLWREGESKQQPSMDPTTSVKASPSSVEEVYVSCHDIEASNVTIRLYYPTEKQKVPVSQASWLPKCWFYLWGYYDCTSIPKFLLPFVYPFALNVKIESGQDQTLLPPPPSASSSSPPSKRSYPLLIFSHGLCGMRTTYSKYCIDMARQGFIVAALEHADKSASVAQRNNYNEYVRFHRPNAKLEKRPSQTDDEYLREFRSSQLEIRKREVFETLSILKDLDSGTSIENKLGKNEMQNALVQASFKGCIDWEKLVVSGHSFGGSTVLEVLQEAKHPFVASITMDPWMVVYNESTSKKVTTPMLSLQSERFHWRENLDRIKSLLDGIPTSIFGFIANTKHQDFSDMGYMMPGISKRMGLSGNADPIQTLRILRNSSLEFLSRHGVVGLLSSYSIIENYFESKDQVAEDGLLVLSAKAFAHIYALISEWEESKKKK